MTDRALASEESKSKALPHCPICGGHHSGNCTWVLAGFKPKVSP
jgi:hypothetical protein